MTSIQIESSVIKLKSDVRVLKVQLNMKLWWSAHLCQIEANHVTWMLALSWLEVFTWRAIFIKVRQIYSAVVRSEIAFKASVWHQREKEKELSDKECRLETLQNQTLHHVAKTFKRVSIKTLKAEMYTSSLHVHLNMLQDKITLRSWINDCTQKIRQACKLICTHLMSIIFRSFVIKKVMLLNNSIQEDMKIQSRRKQLVLAVMISTSDSIAIAQYHRSQWNQWWKKYRKYIADVHIILTQRLHLFNKMIKMQNDFQRVESTFVTYIKIKCIDLNAYLHFRNVSDADSMWCNCNWNHQMTKHVLMHCLNWLHLRSRMLQNVNFLNYWIIVTIMKSFKATARMMMKMKLLKQFKVTKSLIL